MQQKQKHILLNRWPGKPKGLVLVVARLIFISIFLLGSALALAQGTAPTTPPATATSATATGNVIEKDLEVAMGIDAIEKVDFDYSTKMTIGNEQFLKLVLVPQKREIIFKGLKPGRTTVLIRDTLG